MDGNAAGIHLEDLFVEPGMRGRGIGTEVLHTLPKALAKAGMKAIHLEVGNENPRARKLYEKLGFRAREGYGMMTREL